MALLLVFPGFVALAILPWISTKTTLSMFSMLRSNFTFLGHIVTRVQWPFFMVFRATFLKLCGKPSQCMFTHFGQFGVSGPFAGQRERG